MLILHIRILSSPLFVFLNSLYLFIPAPRSGALNLSGITILACLCSIYPSFSTYTNPVGCDLFPSYIAMCLEKTAVYLHGYFHACALSLIFCVCQGSSVMDFE